MQDNSGTALNRADPQPAEGPAGTHLSAAKTHIYQLPRALNMLQIYTATARAELGTIKHCTEFRE